MAPSSAVRWLLSFLLVSEATAGGFGFLSANGFKGFSLAKSFSAGPIQETHAVIGGTAGGQAPVLMAPMPDEEAAVVQASSEIVTGFVEGFLNKQNLQQGELDCLSTKAGQAATKVMSLSSNVAVLMERVMGRDVDNLRVPAALAGAAGASGAELESGLGGRGAEEGGEAIQAPQPEGEGDNARESLDFFYGDRRLGEGPLGMMAAPAFLMELGYSIQEASSMVHDIIKECVHEDARQALRTATAHMKSLSYVSGRLMANGADVITELADAAVAFRSRRHTDFGHNMGKALRKVLLSHSANATLPEGLPDKYELANISAGLIRGFFGEGSELDLAFQGEPGVVRIDLHDCVGRNLLYFQQVWMQVMYFYAQRATQGAHRSLVDSDTVEFGTALAFGMMQLPSALQKCDLTPEQQDMLMDSIKALGSGMHARMQMPQADVSKGKVATDMAQTVKDWANTDWYTFGLDLGKMMQEMAVKVYENKYSVDSRGRLQRLSEQLNGSVPLGGVAAVVALAALSAALLGVRSRCGSRRRVTRSEPLEMGSEPEWAIE